MKKSHLFLELLVLGLLVLATANNSLYAQYRVTIESAYAVDSINLLNKSESLSSTRPIIIV